MTLIKKFNFNREKVAVIEVGTACVCICIYIYIYLGAPFGFITFEGQWAPSTLSVIVNYYHQLNLWD